MKTKPTRFGSSTKSINLPSVGLACIFAITALSSQAFAQQDPNQLGSFDQLVKSFRNDNTIILEGPALQGPTEVRSKSITPVQAPQTQERIILGEKVGPIPGPFDDVPSVISPYDANRYPADDPFLNGAPSNQIPSLQGPVIQDPGQIPNSGWQSDFGQAETVPQQFSPELTAPRAIPNRNPANISPAIPSSPGPAQLIVPQLPTDGYRQPQTEYRQPQAEYRQPNFAPRTPPEFDRRNPDCPIERAMRERQLRAQSGYPPAGYLRNTGYVPYGGLGLNREYDRRSEIYRARYLEYKQLERELELLRQRYQRAPSRYAPYGSRSRGFGY